MVRIVGALALGLAMGTAALAQQPAPSTAEMRDLVEAMRANAKASRETADYARVMPDLLDKILAKLDKIEDKLDKIENATKANAPRR